MEEHKARRVADALRDRGIDARLARIGTGVYAIGVRVGGGREAIWGAGGGDLEAEVLRNGNLVGFVPEIQGSGSFDDAQIVDAIARTDYDEPVARERPEAPPPAPALPREGGVFRRFLDGFRYGS